MVHDPVEQGHDKCNSFLSSSSFNSECLQRFISITCAEKLFSNVKLELTCSNLGVVGSLTFDVYSIKLEMNYSATSIRE